MCPALAGNPGFPNCFLPSAFLEGELHFPTLGWHRSSHPSSHKRFPWDTSLGETFTLPGPGRPKQDGPVSRSHFLARTPPRSCLYDGCGHSPLVRLSLSCGALGTVGLNVPPSTEACCWEIHLGENQDLVNWKKLSEVDWGLLWLYSCPCPGSEPQTQKSEFLQCS